MRTSREAVARAWLRAERAQTWALGSVCCVALSWSAVSCELRRGREAARELECVRSGECRWRFDEDGQLEGVERRPREAGMMAETDEGSEVWAGMVGVLARESER